MKTGILLKPRLVQLVAAGIALLAILTVSVYVQFAWQIKFPETIEKVEHADAIVVFTGDGNRISPAVDLLQGRYGKRLLISGVNHKTSVDALRHAVSASEALFNCCVDLDYLAYDTRGNALNTSYWAHFHDYERLIVVTSDYHMPRSLLLMQQAMPDVTLKPAPVVSKTMQEKSYFSVLISPVTLYEFGKYLIARFRFEPAAKYLTIVARNQLRAYFAG
ncbi:MAG: YdcF family protein [Pseudomonadota bacterium]